MTAATQPEQDPGPFPRLALEASFEDIGALGRAAGWNLDFRQLEPGPLEASLLVLGHKDIQLARFRFNRAYHQLGEPPEGFVTFGLPDEDIGTLLWNGIETPAKTLINFSHEKHLDAVNPPGGSAGFVLSVAPLALERSALDLGIPRNVLNNLLSRRFSDPLVAGAPVLRETLESLVAVARSGGDDALAAWAPIFNHDLPALILRCLAAPAQRPRMVQPVFRARALERAVTLLASHDHMPENVETLCKVAGASWATLLRAFKDEYGVSPKRYMKIRRLTAVREALLQSEDVLRISDVANQWGFWHMGSFAADYRAQFGELPSETRKRIRTADAF